ncbi:MAG: cupin domain-containing protein [Magnetococcales bacterium]|nr:cupin domain-containing protein [Magnetococcales bacterium]
MSGITLIRNPDPKELEEQGVESWSIWSKEASTFPWSYDAKETCFFLEGEVVVTPDGGEPVKMGQGDLVTFPAGMSCTWEIIQPVRKHYIFE